MRLVSCGRAFDQKAYNACRNRGERNAVTARRKDAAQLRPEGTAKELSKNNFYNFACDLTDDFVDGTDAAGDSV